MSRLDRLVADIRQEGDDCRLVSADLYQGPVQKDGRVLLALRRFLQQARDRVGLTSVVMIGRFPEAQILRRFPWAPAFERMINGVATNGRRYLAVDPELVAGSADIVLADLTGHWEDVYQPSVTTRALYMLPAGASAEQERPAATLARYTRSDAYEGLADRLRAYTVIYDGVRFLEPADVEQTVGQRRVHHGSLVTHDQGNPVATPAQ